jgi:parallel beta-helix repeat protein
MKRNAFLLVAGSLLCAALTASATTRYVNLNNPAPVAPYTNWLTAATNIQDAIDVAGAGEEVFVTNGVYQTGVRAVYGMTNRVAVTKALTVRSLNGPAVTSIVGSGPNGPAAVRCAYLTGGATLAGFTLTNGAVQTSGDDYRNRSGGGVWCESWSAVVTNCVLAGNSADHNAGGAYVGTLTNCTLTGNSANQGGGADYAMLNNCTLTGNSADAGGGASRSVLNNCTVAGNSADYGGGAYDSTLHNCTLTGNSASAGGGAAYATLNNCTVAGNSAYSSGGGDYAGTLTNCIVYYNTAPDGANYSFGTLNYCCTTPLPAGTGNVATEPLFVDTNGWSNLRLQAGSPCINAGLNAYAPGPTDLDGNPRISGSIVDAGAYEFQFPQVSYVALASANPVWPYSSWATAATNIQDAVDVTEPGGMVWVTNGVYQTGARAVYGMSNRVTVTKAVTVRSVNGPAVTSIVGSGPNGPAAVRCVYLTSGATLAGFTLTNGATQASLNDYTNQSGGGVWCESWSAVVTNCVLVGNAAYYHAGGAYVGTLNNCTLTGNSADNGGGGADYAMLTNCTLTGNSALYGGGASRSVLNNCTLTGNSALYGGGANDSTLNNCTLTGNSAWLRGGGAYESTLHNCIVYYNTAPDGANYSFGTLNYCCTAPLPAGTGNFATEPLFVDTNGWSNLRLQAGSPCINAGNNAYAPGPTDLDGNPRIFGGTVDVGAYEFQSDPFHAWLAQYGLPTDGSADYLDTDTDGHNNWQEWVAGTNPTNALSALRMLSATGGISAVTVTWSSVTSRTYALERATNLGAAPAFSVLQSNLPGLPDTTSFTDTNALGSASRFYRVRVEN